MSLPTWYFFFKIVLILGVPCNAIWILRSTYPFEKAPGHCVGNFDRDCIVSIDQLGEYYPLNGLPCGSEVNASACNAGDLGSIPGSGRYPGEGNGNPLQYSCLENPMDRGAWWATVHGVAKSQTWPSDFTFTLLIVSLPVHEHRMSLFRSSLSSWNVS